MNAAQVDFNSDLGESFGLWERGADEAMLRSVSSANVACGFHAGDPSVMRRTLESAKRSGVAVGAHPGYPDLLGFGRRAMAVSPSDVRDYVLFQVAGLDGFVRAAGLELHHVKPHGALYMAALEDRPVADAIAEAVMEFREGLPVYTIAGSEMWDAATRAGLPAFAEFFADRPLRKDGSVVMFGWKEVFDPEPDVVAERAVAVATSGSVTSLEGPAVNIKADTICVHSDTPGAELLGPAVRKALESANVRVAAPGRGASTHPNRKGN